MYNNILVPIVLDGQHDIASSFEVARALAAPEAAFTVLNVLEAIPSYAETEIPADIVAARRQEFAHELVKAAKDLPGAKSQLISGHSGRSILDYAEANDIDCIVIRSHKPGLEDYFLGSTAARVVRHAKCSVHVIR